MAVVYQPHPKQMEAHRAFLTDNQKRGTLFWGRQVGKTMWSVHHSWMSSIMKQGQYFIVFRTYSQASQVVWKQYLHLIPKELIAHVNNDDLRITFHHLKGPIKLPGIGWIKVEHDPDLPASSIRLLGSDQAESHRGIKANGIIFDEFADQSPDNWTSVYQPMFSATDGWAIFMGTPKGYNHFYDLVEESKAHPEEYFFSQATWRDNPAISVESISRARRDANRKGTLNTFLQEYELEFRAVQGSVYPMFKREIHVVKPEDVPSGGALYVTIDFGWAVDHPTAVNFVKIDIEDRWWVYDEIHVIETPLEDIVRMIRLKTAGERIIQVIADSARPDLVDVLAQAGLPVVAVNKAGKSVASGIALLGTRMKPRLQLVGIPKPQIFFSNCPETIIEFEQYKYAEAKGEKLINEEPIKKYDNHPDGLRYLAIERRFGSIQSETAPKPTVSFGEYGLPI